MNSKFLYKLSYGMYVISSKKGKKFNGQIANTIMQVTSDPQAIIVCINKNNLTHEYIKASKVFTVSVLSTETPMKFIGSFGFKSGRDIEKFKGVNYRIGKTGVPIVLENAVAYLEARVKGSMDAGTHTLFVADVVDGDILSDGKVMTYEYYHVVKKGLVSKNAPHYIKNEKKELKEEVLKMKKYRCTVCGYIYDPQKGDPDTGIKTGTPFEELPDDWVCPVCGAGKDAFEKEN